MAIGAYDLLLIVLPVLLCVAISYIVYAVRKRKAGGKKARVSPAKHERLTRLFKTTGIALAVFAAFLTAEMWYTTQKEYNNAWEAYPHVLEHRVQQIDERSNYYEEKDPDMPKRKDYFTPYGYAKDAYIAALRTYVESMQSQKEYAASVTANVLYYETAVSPICRMLWAINNDTVGKVYLYDRDVSNFFNNHGETGIVIVVTNIFGIDDRVMISLLLGLCLLSGLALYAGAEKYVRLKSAGLYAVLGALITGCSILTVVPRFVMRCVSWIVRSPGIFYKLMSDNSLVGIVISFGSLVAACGGLLLAVCLAAGKIKALFTRKNAQTAGEESGVFCFMLGVCATAASLFAVFIAGGLWAAANVFFGAAGLCLAAYVAGRQKKILSGQKPCLIIGGCAAGVALVFAVVTAVTHVNLYVYFPLLAVAWVFFMLAIPRVRSLLAEPLRNETDGNKLVYERTYSGKGYMRIARKKRTRRG